MKSMQYLLTGVLVIVNLLTGCSSITTHSKVIYKNDAFILKANGNVAVFPAFARSGVHYAKRKAETILKYHLLMNKRNLGWKMIYPDQVKQKILNNQADDLYLVIYHKYNALSHFVARDLAAIGKKINCTRLIIPEMIQESVKSGPYWISHYGPSWTLSKLYDDYYVRLVLHIFDVDKGRFVYRIQAVGKVRKGRFRKENIEEDLGNGYSAAIKKMLQILCAGKK